MSISDNFSINAAIVRSKSRPLLPPNTALKLMKTIFFFFFFFFNPKSGPAMAGVAGRAATALSLLALQASYLVKSSRPPKF